MKKSKILLYYQKLNQSNLNYQREFKFLNGLKAERWLNQGVTNFLGCKEFHKAYDLKDTIESKSTLKFKDNRLSMKITFSNIIFKIGSTCRTGEDNNIWYVDLEESLRRFLSIHKYNFFLFNFNNKNPNYYKINSKFWCICEN